MELSRRKFLAFGLVGALAAGCKREPIVEAPSPTPSQLISATPEAAASETEPLPVVKWDGKGDLREYYLHGKYLQSERDAVSNVIGKLFGHLPHSQRHQIEAEILSFHYVIFHQTKLHVLSNNHKVITRHREALKEVCQKYLVPFLPVLAITSWENSGGSNKASWADAVGLGMMTWGAVDQAHRHAADKALALKEQADWKRYHAKIKKDQAMLKEASLLERRAATMNVAERHRKQAAESKIEDERTIPQCNLEDVVLFFDFLLSQYGGRVDHAIAAYHKGVQNQDDIVFDYIRRRDPTVLFPRPSNRQSFLQALERLNVTYLDLWNDKRSREMLNGLRTVEGEPTTRRNAYLALGDESDIYPWKVLGSLSALLAGEEYLQEMMKRYSGSQLPGEVRGLPAFLGEQGRAQGEKLGCLVKYSSQFWRSESGDSRQAWVRPEMIGYLESLRKRMNLALGKSWTLVTSALGAALNSAKPWEKELHSKGVAVKISVAGLDNTGKEALKKTLTHDYLFDRIYLRSGEKDYHLVLNPRFGADFMKSYESYSKGEKA